MEIRFFNLNHNSQNFNFLPVFLFEDLLKTETLSNILLGCLTNVMILIKRSPEKVEQGEISLNRTHEKMKLICVTL